MTVTVDTGNSGLAMVLKDYQEEALRLIWSKKGEVFSSRQVWMGVNKRLDGRRSISRASVINFLNAMVDDGVLDYKEITGKGGYRRIYSARFDEKAYKKYIAETVLKNLLRDFPNATQEAIEDVGH